MALPPEEREALKAWNAAHRDEEQYNLTTGKKIPGSNGYPAIDQGVQSGFNRRTPAATPVPAAKAPAKATPAAPVKGSGKLTRGTGTSVVPPGAPSINDEELAQQYGLTSALIHAYPELDGIFKDAVAGSWTADKFQAKFRNSNFYRSMSDTQRKALVMSYTDPATYGQLWHTTQDHMRNLMGDIGADLSLIHI